MHLPGSYPYARAEEAVAVAEADAKSIPHIERDGADGEVVCQAEVEKDKDAREPGLESLARINGERPKRREKKKGRFFYILSERG